MIRTRHTVQVHLKNTVSYIEGFWNMISYESKSYVYILHDMSNSIYKAKHTMKKQKEKVLYNYLSLNLLYAKALDLKLIEGVWWSINARISLHCPHPQKSDII